MTMKDSNVLRNAILTGILSALCMAAYFLILSKMESNTLIYHNIGKTALIVLPVFLLVKSHFHRRGKLKLNETFILGGVFSISAAIVLVLSELALHRIFSVPLTPDEFLESEIGFPTLYFLLTLEIFGYALLSLLLGFQFYKNRKEHNPS